MPRSRLAALSAIAVTLAGLTTAWTSVSATADVQSAAACGELFDDFHYTSHTDPTLTSHGWSARSNAGGPGVPGATWAPENITFPTVDGDKARSTANSTSPSTCPTAAGENRCGR